MERARKGRYGVAEELSLSEKEQHDPLRRPGRECHKEGGGGRGIQEGWWGWAGVDGKYRKETRELWSRTRSGELLSRRAALGVN